MAGGISLGYNSGKWSLGFSLGIGWGGGVEIDLGDSGPSQSGVAGGMKVTGGAGSLIASIGAEAIIDTDTCKYGDDMADVSVPLRFILDSVDLASDKETAVVPVSPLSTPLKIGLYGFGGMEVRYAW